MFQFPGFPLLRLWIHLRVTGRYPRRVSPFGYLRIKACLRLPVAFRSLPRPSSAFGALASTLCSSSLDFFLRPMFALFPVQLNCYTNLLVQPNLQLALLYLISSFSCMCGCQSTVAAKLPPSGHDAPWWVAMDSNHRPLAYQASALTS